MSKAASKVIKSERLNMTLPFPLGRCLGLDPIKENELVNEFAATLSGRQGEVTRDSEYSGSSEQNLQFKESAQREVALILAETEEMVKELLSTAREEAESILLQAKEEAENILLDSREELETLKEQSRQTGYKEGYDRALSEASTEAEAIRMEASRVLDAAKVEKDRIVVGAEGDIVELAMTIAERVIREELQIRPELVGNMVKTALGMTADLEEITIKVNPEDLDYVLSLNGELRKEAQGMGKLKIVPDEIINRGGCVVETTNGTVDARVERQLAEIREALMEVS